MHQCDQDSLAVSYPDGVWFRENQKFLIVGNFLHCACSCYTGLLLGAAKGGGQLFWMNPWHICVVKPPKLSVQGSVGRVGLSNWLCLSVCHQINPHKFEKRKTVTYALWCCLQLRCLGNAPSRVFPCFSWCKHWWLVWQGAGNLTKDRMWVPCSREFIPLLS